MPTFRDADGLWRNYRPEELATIGAFERDPRTVWEWYEWRRGFLATCEPNEGHRALARFFLGRGEAGIVTQNVDGLHTRAAIDEAGDAPPDAALPIEIHGAIARDRCNDCGLRAEAEPLAVRDEAPRRTGPKRRRRATTSPAAPSAAAFAAPMWSYSARCSTARSWNAPRPWPHAPISAW